MQIETIYLNAAYEERIKVFSQLLKKDIYCDPNYEERESSISELVEFKYEEWNC